MAWISVEKIATEIISEDKPKRYKLGFTGGTWTATNKVTLPKGSINKLIGRSLTWDDEPVEIKEEL